MRLCREETTESFAQAQLCNATVQPEVILNAVLTVRAGRTQDGQKLTQLVGMHREKKRTDKDASGGHSRLLFFFACSCLSKKTLPVGHLAASVATAKQGCANIQTFEYEKNTFLI